MKNYFFKITIRKVKIQFSHEMKKILGTNILGILLSKIFYVESHELPKRLNSGNLTCFNLI